MLGPRIQSTRPGEGDVHVQGPLPVTNHSWLTSEHQTADQLDKIEADCSIHKNAGKENAKKILRSLVAPKGAGGYIKHYIN